MGFWDRITKARPERNASDEPAHPIYRFFFGERRLVEYKDVISARSGVCHPVILRCLLKIATSASSIDYYAEQDPKATATERSDNQRAIKALNDVLSAPTDTLAADQLRFWMALSMAAYGRVPFKVGMGVSNPNGIYPLDPEYVLGIPNSRGIIEEYRYGNGEEGQRIPSRRKAERDGGGVAKKAYAHEIFWPNLTGMQEVGKNMSPLATLGLPAQVITALLKRAVDTAEGALTAKYILGVGSTTTNPQADKLKKMLSGNVPDGDDASNVLQIRTTDFKVEKLENDLNNIHSKVPLDDMTRMIAGAFGIPVALLGLGAADAAKFAGNYVESRQSFWEDTIIPGYLSPIARGLTAALCPPGVRISFDYDTIPAIVDRRMAVAEKAAKLPFLSNREKRLLIGYEAEIPTELRDPEPPAPTPPPEGDA